MKKFTDIVIDIDNRNYKLQRPANYFPIKEALKRFSFNYPQDKKRILIITGTNGKGSVAKTLETLLLATGARVALFTSPHLISMTERIRLCGQNLTESEFVDLYQTIAPQVEDLKLSHFEILTVMATYYFFASPHQPPAEWAIFEVGMGGLNDPTNQLPHATAIITKLGLDHQLQLGPTLLDIAHHKFGIVNHHCQVFHHPLPATVIPYAEEIKNKTQSQWHEAIACNYRVTNQSSIPHYTLISPWGDFPLSLPGERGVENTALALTAFAGLGFSVSQYAHHLHQVSWPGRMNLFEQNFSPCPIYLSGDHNVQGIESLISLLKDYSWQTLHLLVGIGKAKEAEPMLHLLASLPRHKIWLTTSPYKGRSQKDYGPSIHLCSEFIADPLIALRQIAAQSHPQDIIVVTGSLYLIGHLLSHKSLNKSPRSE